MRVFAAVLFSSTVILAPAIAGAQTTTAPAAPVAPATAAPAAPAAQTSPAVGNSTTASANLDEIVCKNQPPTTGSRLGGGRECHTVRQWNEREREAQDITRRQEVGSWRPPGGG